MESKIGNGILSLRWNSATIGKVALAIAVGAVGVGLLLLSHGAHVGPLCNLSCSHGAPM